MYLVPPCGFVHREQVARAEASVQDENIIAEKKIDMNEVRPRVVHSGSMHSGT